MLPFTGVAVMQLVERGKLKLDDDISKYVPEFPMQGRHVTVRQLLDHTSGIVDYHYLGDPDRGDEPPAEGARRSDGALRRQDVGERTRHQMGLVDLRLSAARHDHRARVGAVVRRVRHRRICSSRPASSTRRTATTTRSCSGLSHAYRRFENGFVPANENDMAYNADLRICSTVGDFYKLWSALADQKLIRAETFTMMQTARARRRI